MQNYNKFLIALNDALRNNESEFMCPVCDGKATIKKFSNGNINAECNGCKLSTSQLAKI